MKYGKFLIAVIVLVAVSFSSFFVIDYYNKKNDSDNNEKNNLNLFGFNLNDVKSLEIINESGTFEFEINNDIWEMVKGEKFEFNKNKLVAISTYMSNLKAERIVAKNRDKDEAFGLKGNMIITVSLINGDKNKLEMGDMTPTKDSYYVRINDEDNVYTIPLFDGDEIIATREHIKSAYLFDVLDSNSINYIKYVKSGEVIFDMKKDSSWIMKEPFEELKINTANVVSLVDSITRATSSEFIEENPEDLSKYGLDNPSYELYISNGDKTANVLFGDIVDGNPEYLYVYDMDKKEVSVYNIGPILLFDYQTVDVLIRDVHNEYLIDLDKIDLKMGEETLEIKILNKDNITNIEELQYELNGKVLAKDKFDDFYDLYRSLNGLQFEVVNYEAKPEGKPEITITYIRKDGVNTEIELIPTEEDSNLLYVMKNGVYTGHVVRRYAIEVKNGIKQSYNYLKTLIE